MRLVSMQVYSASMLAHTHTCTHTRTHAHTRTHTHTHTHTLLYPPCRLNVDRAMELYEKACQLILSKIELAQCVASYELAKAQVKVCEELGLKLEDVMKQAEGRLKQSVGL